MQNASPPQKAGRGGSRARLRAAPFLALLAPTAQAVAEPAGLSPGDAGAPAAPHWPDHDFEPAEAEGFVPASAQPGWSPAASRSPPAPPPVPIGGRNSEAPPGTLDGGPSAEASPPSGRVGEDEAVAAREQLLASIVLPPFAAGEPNPGGGGSGPPTTSDTGTETDPASVPSIVRGQSGEGMIATLTVTRRVAPDWVADAVRDDPSVVRLVGPATAGLPADGLARNVSVAWADLDGDGRRDGHLYRIDNANDLAVTVQVRIVGGATLPGTATVAGDSTAFIWVPLTTAKTLQFLGTDASGAAIAWTRAVNTQNGSDMTTTTVTRAAQAGEVHVAGSGADVFLFAPGDGVDAILGYDPGQDSVMLPAGTAARIVDVAGTAALVLGPTNREGIVFDGIAWSPSLGLAELNVIFA